VLEKKRAFSQVDASLVLMGRETSTAELIDFTGRAKARDAKSGRAKASRTKASAAKASRTAKSTGAEARRTKAGALEREALLTQRTLRVFDDIMAIADSLPEDAGDDAREKAWRAVDDSDPIRVLFAQQLLEVSGQTVREWIDKGVLESVGSSPVKVTLASVLEVKDIVDELRKHGKDRDLVSAVLNKLELEELGEDDRFLKSLEQMKRGERGKFPARYDV
jgi:hypothetical protein